jgi:hypothetical protein
MNCNGGVWWGGGGSFRSSGHPIHTINEVDAGRDRARRRRRRRRWRRRRRRRKRRRTGGENDVEEEQEEERMGQRGISDHCGLRFGV